MTRGGGTADKDDVEVVRKHLSSSSMSSSLALYACGSNASGQLGIGHLDDVHRLTACHLDPSVHDALAGHRVEVVDLCGSSAHSLLLLRLTEPDPSGRSQKQPRTLLLGAGTNTLGQLGPRCRLWADTRPELAYKPLDLLTPLGLTHDEWEPVKVATTWTTSFAVYRRTGTPPPDAPAAAGSSSDQAAGGSSIPPPTQMVVACGSSDFGECGLPPSSHQVGRVAITTPGDMPSIVDLALAPGETVEHIRGGQRHVVCVVRGTSGAQRLVGWGANRRGELDPLGAAPAPPPAAPSPPDGDKRKGKAAVRSTTLTPTVLPLRLEPREAVADLALGSGHTVVRLSSGRLAAWGSDLKGQIAGLDEATGVAQVAATWGGTYLLDARRILWSQGSDSHGQLLRSTDGAGPRGQVDLAAYSEGEQGIVSLRTGSEHVLLQLGREGGPDEVWAGGWNEHGNLGLGDATDRPALARVPLPAGVRRVRGVWGGLAATWIWAEG